MICPFLHRALGAILLAILLIGCAATPPPAARMPETAQIALGQALLSDRRLSLRGDLACLDCHIPALGYADGKPVATADGINTPTLYGLAHRTTFGWFSPEHASIEAFLRVGPLDNPREMGPLTESTLDRLRRDPAMQRAYAQAGLPMTWDATAQALATAIRSIPDPTSSDLSPAAQHGQALFAELGCMGCHHGPALGADAYVDTGVRADHRRVRIPSLIALAQTAPYFDDGSMATLEDVVRFYERGGDHPGPTVNRAIASFVLTDAERRDLVAYLASR